MKAIFKPKDPISNGYAEAMAELTPNNCYGKSIAIYAERSSTDEGGLDFDGEENEVYDFEPTALSITRHGHEMSTAGPQKPSTYYSTNVNP